VRGFGLEVQGVDDWLRVVNSLVRQISPRRGKTFLAVGVVLLVVLVLVPALRHSEKDAPVSVMFVGYTNVGRPAGVSGVGFELRAERAMFVVSNCTNKRLFVVAPTIQFTDGRAWRNCPDAWMRTGVHDPKFEPHQSREFIRCLPAGKCTWRLETTAIELRARWRDWLHDALKNMGFNSTFTPNKISVRTREYSLEP
jgi:hypothetical protein